MSRLRRILGFSRRERIRNEAMKTRAGIKLDIVQITETKWLSFFGHIKRMPNSRYPKITLEGGLARIRLHGRPPMHWIDTIQSSCSVSGIHSSTEASRKAENTQLWRSFIMQQPSLGNNLRGQTTTTTTTTNHKPYFPAHFSPVDVVWD